MDSNGVALGDRGEVIYTTAARAIAYKLPLPTSPVDNPYAYFLDKYASEVMGDLCAINEDCVIRVEQAAELVKHIWVFRYSVAYDAASLSVMATLDVIAKEGDRYLSPKYQEILKKYSNVMISSTRIFADAVRTPEAV
ncbi:MAG TPA: hypothetical protein VN081_00505 [Dongiaceae bacterium]|nr:hypothetical protein [Dongiaceae bacterium]